MADLYVSTSGSDSNTGSKSSPFRSIKEAAEHAASGTTVHVAPGTYQGALHTETDGVTFVSGVKWGARIIPGSDDDQREAWNNGGADVIIDGFEIDGSRPQGGTPWLYGVVTSGSDSTVRNVKVHDIVRDSDAWDAANSNGQGGAGIMADGFAGGTGITLSGNQVYEIGPDGEDSTLVHGIYIGTSGRVLNNTVHDVVGDGISSWHDATDLTIAGNTIRDVNGAGILIGSGNRQHHGGPNDHSVISNNTVTDNLKGIEEGGDTGENNTYKGNTVRDNGTDWSLQNGLKAAMALEPAWDAESLLAGEPAPEALGLLPGLDGAAPADSAVALADAPYGRSDAVSALLDPSRPRYDTTGLFFTP